MFSSEDATNVTEMKHSRLFPLRACLGRPLMAAIHLSICVGIASLLTGSPAAADVGATRPAKERVAFRAEAFEHPEAEFRAKFRWWWPHGLVDPQQIAREVDAMADNGFGGAEIADVHHSVTEPLAPDTHGWGTEPWRVAVEAALRQAKARGLTMDLTVGPSWPAAVPTITPDSPEAKKELATGQVVVRAGEIYRGPVPEPEVAPERGVRERALLLLQAVRIADGVEPTARPLTLVAGTPIDLTGSIDEGRLEWQAPRDGNWLLIAYWERGSGQRPERGPHSEPLSYVVDHFSRAGAEAVIDFWETNILTDDLRQLLREVGGTFFEDSIEMETDATLWTPGLLDEFERRAGYSLIPYLPLVVQIHEKHIFRYDQDIAGHVQHDWWQVMGTLFLEKHLEVLQEWARGYGMQLRVQPYGMRTDATRAAAVLDISEGESLGFKNLDDYRSLAGGRDMAGHRILSNEAAAFAGGAYSTTWKRVLQTLNPQFAAGVNQTVFHGFSYATVPGAKWPGFAAFTPYGGYPGYAESWGPRMPSWRHVPEIADYFARTQYVLQSGQPRVDVAFVRQKGYAGSGSGAAWFTHEGGRHGWTHAFISPPLLDFPLAEVRDGLFAPDGPGFQVLVLEGDAFHGRRPALEVDAAKRLLELARAGLPMIIVGDWSNAVPSGLAQEGEEARLREVMRELFALPKVVNVADRPEIPNGLEELGLQPRVRHEPASLVNAQRTDGDADFYLFANQSADAPVAVEVVLPRRSPDQIPHRLNAWTGEIAPLAVYRETDDGVAVSVELRPSMTALFSMAPGQDGAHADLHVSKTDADKVFRSNGALRLRTKRAGTFTSELSNGNTVQTKVEEVPNVSEISVWQLRVEDWQPGESETDTHIEIHEVALDALRPWTEIPELEDVSGVGIYRTTLELGSDWESKYGAMLDLGQVFDTVRVRVNGQSVGPVDPLDPVVDLGGFLESGQNTLEIEVSTTLNNRLRVSDVDVYSVNQRQPYGLLGPVRLIPYVESVIEPTP